MFIYDLQLACKVRVSIWNSHTYFLLVYLPPPHFPSSSSFLSHTAHTPLPHSSFLLCSVVFSTLGRISRCNKKGIVRKYHGWRSQTLEWKMFVSDGSLMVQEAKGTDVFPPSPTEQVLRHLLVEEGKAMTWTDEMTNRSSHRWKMQDPKRRNEN